MEKVTTITVLGAGYVGLTTAALLAHADYKVYLVEPNRERLRRVQSGKSFFYEEGIDAVITAAVSAGNLIATDQYSDAIPTSDVVFSCVGTPDNPDGSSNLSYVFAAAETAAALMKPGTIYIQKSTVPVGTGARVEALFQTVDAEVSYVSNPEFLREGTALRDTLYFDRVVAGGHVSDTATRVLDIYRQLEKHRERISRIANITAAPRKNLYLTTSLESAELIKVTSNAFLALKISFANSIAMLADKTGADVNEVMNAVGADERIGQAFLNAGRGYGGGCFPKDVSGLIATGLEHGVDLEIMRASATVNDTMPGYVIEKLQDALGSSLRGKSIAVLGLAFKAGTSDVRKSPGITIANRLHSVGAKVRVYDPQALSEAKADLADKITGHDSIDSALQGADAAIIATEWPEFADYSATEMMQLLAGNTLIDAVNIYPKDLALAAGLRYLGVGR